jgi:hypothetical protein
MAHYKTAQAQNIPSSKMAQNEMTNARNGPSSKRARAKNGPKAQNGPQY